MAAHLRSIWDSALHGDETAVAAHIAAGTDVNCSNAVGCTPAHTAARGGQAAILKFLAAKGADLELTNNEGRLPVHEAAKSGHLEALKALHELGCALDVSTEQGQSVLDVAKGEPVRQYIKSVLAAKDSSQQHGSTLQKGSQRTQNLRRAPNTSQPGVFKKPMPGSGSSLHSGKAKKEYLKWKRTQKQLHSGADSEEDLPAITPTGATPSTIASMSISQGESKQPGHDSTFLQQTAPAGVRVAQQAHPAVVKQHRREPLVSASRDVPVHYAQLELLEDSTNSAIPGPGQSQASVEGTSSTAEVRMPRCRPEEVGMSQEGLSLGMPKRPAWRGRVHTAEELHALEENAFGAWRQSIASGFAPGRVSWYEDRLEYWRQLWRVLDLCHVALMIVDARNPLLHFSQALAHHVLKEQHNPLVLVLNKADLVPDASVKTWVDWFTARHPGIAVVASSAAAESAEGTAHRILEAVLNCTICYQGQTMKVADVVGMSTDKILLESQQRNAASKRHVAAAGRHNTAAGVQTGDESASAAAFTTEGSDDDEQDWTVKGNKARKMGAVRKKRVQRMSKHAAVASSSRHVASAIAKPGQRPSRVQAARLGMPQTGGGKLTAACQDVGSVEASDEPWTEDEGTGDGASHDDAQEDHTIREGPEDEGEGEGEGEENEDDTPNCNADLDQWEQDDLKTGVPEDQIKQAFTTAGRADHAGAQTVTSKRPVVVCVVGEPNVGKSSTMNALLGAHKVAVSSHPGRTKHYQTHYMTARLMLCDCPGLVFPRLDVPLHMQVLYGSYPIARCRDPYSVIGYLAAHCWPRLHVALGLRKVDEQGAPVNPAPQPGQAPDPNESWTPLELCEAFAARKSWKLRKGGRLDVYRAANWLLRAALAGKHGVSLAFLPPAADST